MISRQVRISSIFCAAQFLRCGGITRNQMAYPMAEGSGPTSVFEARYANHFQVGHNEFEFIFDFDQFHFELPGGVAHEPAPQVRIVRIVMGPPFAKSLLETLTRAVNEYEELHGAIG
jgi:hypothetical protein